MHESEFSAYVWIPLVTVADSIWYLTGCLGVRCQAIVY